MELTDRPVQRRGSRLARAPRRMAGWRLVVDRRPARQGVAIVVPHTSNRDVAVGVRACLRLGGDPDADLAAIAGHGAGVRGYRPHLASPNRRLPRP